MDPGRVQWCADRATGDLARCARSPAASAAADPLRARPAFARFVRSRSATSATRRLARCRRRSPTCRGRDRRATRSVRRWRPRRSPLARESRRRSGRQHALHRHGDGGATGGILRQRRLERGVGHLVHAQRAHQRMRADPIDQRRAADDDPGLRSAEELVAAEAAHVDAGRDRRPHRGLFTERVSRESADGRCRDLRRRGC